MNDEEHFQRMEKSFEHLGISKEERLSFYQVLAGILHLGNITFTSKGPKEPSKLADLESMNLAANLLGVTPVGIDQVLCQKTVSVKGSRKESVYTVPLIVDQSIEARDSLAKILYFFLFDWLVKRINQVFVCQDDLKGSFIGVLDIFG